MRCALGATAAVAAVLMGVTAAVAGGGALRLTTHPAEDRSPSWSPDGTRLLFESDRDGDFEIYVIGRDGSGLRRLTDSPGGDRSPAWSPDGERFVFGSERDGARGLWIGDLAGGEPRSLIADPSPELVPDWSPDGAWVAFSSERDGNLELYRVRIEDGSLERLTDDPHRDLWPRYSPDGGSLVFFSRRGTSGATDDLYRLDLASGAVTRITTHPGHHDFVPDYAPDGVRVVAGLSDRERGRRELVIHHLVQRTVRPFAGGYHRVFHPAWSPDGGWIAYAARATEGAAADIYLERAGAR